MQGEYKRLHHLLQLSPCTSKLKTKLNSVCNTQVKRVQFVSYMEQMFPAFHTPDVSAAPEFTGSYTLCNHRIFKVGKKPQKDGVQPILHRYPNRDKYMNAWRRVKLLHFPVHARYKIPNVSQAHTASNTGDSLVFPRNHRAFPPAWLGCMFCLPQIPSAASQSHDLLQGLLGSALTQWPQRLWLVAALLGKALTNTSGSSHFPPNCPCSFSCFFFFHLDVFFKFFSMPIPHHELPYSHNQRVRCFPPVTTKARYLYTRHRFICNHSCCFC